MKRTLSSVLATAALVVGGSAYLQAQDANTAEALTGDNGRIEDDDDDFDMGWLGLIGLAGLAGLLGRNNHDHNRDRTHGGTAATR
jgi:hypothetical protein